MNIYLLTSRGEEAVSYSSARFWVGLASKFLKKKKKGGDAHTSEKAVIT
jgi:hypothetical protein